MNLINLLVGCCLVLNFFVTVIYGTTFANDFIFLFQFGPTHFRHKKPHPSIIIILVILLYFSELTWFIICTLISPLVPYILLSSPSFSYCLTSYKVLIIFHKLFSVVYSFSDLINSSYFFCLTTGALKTLYCRDYGMISDLWFFSLIFEYVIKSTLKEFLRLITMLTCRGFPSLWTVEFVGLLAFVGSDYLRLINDWCNIIYILNKY